MPKKKKQPYPVGEETVGRTFCLVRGHESAALAGDMAGRTGERKEGGKAVSSHLQAGREGNGKPLLTHFI